MLEANKSAWFATIFDAYNRNLLRRRFAALNLDGGQNLVPGTDPTIIVANHSSWWDGLVCYHLLRRSGTDLFVFMADENLRKYPLFRRLGAFSIDRSNSRDALRSLDYAARLATEKRDRSFLIFPQGKIEPANQKRLHFETGVIRLIDRLAPCRVVNLALRYTFRNDFKPEIFAAASSPLDFSAAPAKTAIGGLEEGLTAALDAIDHDLASENLERFQDCLH